MAKKFSEKDNTIKWIGIITMLIDHIGYHLFPGMMWMRIVGRIAFPCFLYGIIQGTKRTSNYWEYVSRLLFLGVISMPYTPFTLNVMFLLVLFSLSLKFPLLFIPCLWLSTNVEYGIYGFLLGWTIWWAIERDASQGIIAAILLQLMNLTPIQYYSVFSLPLFLTDIRLKLPRMPKYFFYIFYPLHQYILAWLAQFF